MSQSLSLQRIRMVEQYTVNKDFFHGAACRANFLSPLASSNIVIEVNHMTRNEESDPTRDGNANNVTAVSFRQDDTNPRIKRCSVRVVPYEVEKG